MSLIKLFKFVNKRKNKYFVIVTDIGYICTNFSQSRTLILKKMKDLFNTLIILSISVSLINCNKDEFYSGESKLVFSTEIKQYLQKTGANSEASSILVSITDDFENLVYGLE